ncbi:MAG: transglycosylase SLT domain-containing protein [Myxococcota bacterium]
MGMKRQQTLLAIALIVGSHAATAATPPTRNPCDKHARALRDPLLAPAARLELAWCLSQSKPRGGQAKPHWAAVLRDPLWAHNVDVLHRAVPFLLKHGLTKLVLQAAQSSVRGTGMGQPRALVDLPPDNAWDTTTRERFADILFAIAGAASKQQHQALRHKILHRLITEFADTASSKRALQTPWGQAWQRRQLTTAKRLRQARVLVQRHRHEQARRSLRQLQATPLQGQEQAAFLCEVGYLLGKLDRRLREYDKALAAFSALRQCPQPWRRNAAYMSLRIRSIRLSRPGADPQATQLFIRETDTFSRAHAKDPGGRGLADDVLWWQANVLFAQGRPNQADATLMRLLREFPDGDMVPRARFTAALEQARHGNVHTARQRLRAIHLNKRIARAERDKAVYWHGRLLLHPRVDSLAPNANSHERQYGAKILRQLSEQRPATYHGHLAARLLLRSVAHGYVAGDALSEYANPFATVSECAPGGKPGSALVKQAQRWLQAGYTDQAVSALATGASSLHNTADRLQAAFILHQAGALPLCHRLMRGWGWAVPAAFPQQEPVKWRLSYPKAHAEIIDKAAAGSDFPATLLRAVAREESQFSAREVSWAGAHGMFQFMPTTAADEAKKLGLPAPSSTELLDPRLNAKLAAAYLSGLMRKLPHPVLIVAAYNRGPGAVARWWRNSPPSMPVDTFVASIPTDQTREYVVRVVGSWITYAALDGEPHAIYLPLTLPRVPRPT